MRHTGRRAAHGHRPETGASLLGRRTAVERGNTIFRVMVAEAQEFRRNSRAIEGERGEDMNKHGRSTPAPKA